MGWLTASDWAIVALFLAVPVLLLIAADRMERAERRRRRDWWRRHFQEGGLVRALVARWRGPPRLTDRRRDGRD
jgi:hypothetical protein